VLWTCIHNQLNRNGFGPTLRSYGRHGSSATDITCRLRYTTVNMRYEMDLLMLAADDTKSVLVRKSELAKRIQLLPPLRNIMIIDDNEQDARHAAVVLQMLLGPQLVITSHRYLAKAIAELQRQVPDFVVLDDHLPPMDRAETSLKALQRFGFKGPFIIMTGMLDRARKLELEKLGPLGLIHKDDLDSFSLSEVLVRLVKE
jgi:CheY-like chemotaxis protein